MGKIGRYILVCAAAFLFLPFFITSVFEMRTIEQASEPAVIADTQYGFDMNEYIISVVAAEMPASYVEEALKAQAVAARTYTVKYLENNNNIMDAQEIGQQYLTTDEMKTRWGDNFALYYNKISRAVQSTSGEIIKYEGQPIDAVFHAFSAGKTENSEDVWVTELPYLKSVDSSFDENAKDFTYKHVFTGNDFYTKLHDEFEDIVFTGGDIIDQIIINEYTDAGYVKTITIGNKTMEGTKLRQLLGLRSVNFTVYREADKIIFETKGYGHGAGMSQVGANYLAENGYTYKDILTYYYSGVYVE